MASIEGDSTSKSLAAQRSEVIRLTFWEVSVDELDRLAYITGIYAMLNMLYRPTSHPEWLRNASKLPSEALYRPWGTGSPLGYMLTGKLKAVADVYDYVEAECNGM